MKYVLLFSATAYSHLILFPRRILDAIDHPTPESRARAYVYAFLAFLCMLFKVRVVP